MQIDTTILHAKYIYLDWNVIKYMKEPRSSKGDLDERFKSTVFKLKTKYKFPYSMAHIRDRANNYSQEHFDKVKEDFEFAQNINDMTCLAIKDEKLLIVKENICNCFDDYLSQKEEKVSLMGNYLPFTFTIDMEKLDQSHPMYDFLKRKGGILSVNSMEEFLMEMYACIFKDTNMYKRMRNYIEKLDLKKDLEQLYSYEQLTVLNKLLYHMFPFLESFGDNEDTLVEKWPKIAERWFAQNNACIRRDLLLIQGYALLDMHPLFQEPLKKGKNTLDNIVRDGNHCFYASQGQYFVSEDAQTRKKVAFLYKTYGIRTKVVGEEEFLNFFEV